MRTLRNFALAVLAVAALAASRPLLAQQSSDLLPGKQAQELAMTAKTRADHAKLQRHFLALAAKYEAEAADHAAQGQAERKAGDTINGRLFPGSAAKRAQHCDRLSASLKEAAKDAREIAAEHEKLAK